MNIMTRIVLSLSLIPLVVQPAPDIKRLDEKQTTTQKEYAKKTAKIAAYFCMIGGGIFGLRYSQTKYKSDANSIRSNYYFMRTNMVDAYEDLNIPHNDIEKMLEHELWRRLTPAALTYIGGSFFAIWLIKYGIHGLIKEAFSNASQSNKSNNKSGKTTAPAA